MQGINILLNKTIQNTNKLYFVVFKFKHFSESSLKAVDLVLK